MPWQLYRTTQCAKCPWRVTTDPSTIPNGYSVEKHAALIATIAVPGDVSRLGDPLRVMACHTTDGAHCVGWLMNQLGEGNNIALRIQMLSCTNAARLRLRGEQHRTFADTLPWQPHA